MSKISELIKTAERLEAQKTKELEKELDQRVEQLGNNLNIRLEERYKKIDAVLSLQEKKIKRRLINIYLIPLYCLGGISLAIFLVSFIASFYFSYQAKNAYTQMNKFRNSAELYKTASKGFILNHCELPDKTHRVCIQIDPKYKDQTWEKNFKILKMKAE